MMLFSATYFVPRACFRWSLPPDITFSLSYTYVPLAFFRLYTAAPHYQAVTCSVSSPFLSPDPSFIYPFSSSKGRPFKSLFSTANTICSQQAFVFQTASVRGVPPRLPSLLEAQLFWLSFIPACFPFLFVPFSPPMKRKFFFPFSFPPDAPDHDFERCRPPDFFFPPRPAILFAGLNPPGSPCFFVIGFLLCGVHRGLTN